MKTSVKFVCLLAVLPLFACKTELQPSSSEIEIPAESSSSEKNAPSESSSSAGSLTPAPVWTLGCEAFQKASQSSYPDAATFTIADSTGTSIAFYCDYIQQGQGEYAGTIQMRKNSDGVMGLLECRTLLSGTIKLDVLKRTSFYNNEDHDFTGEPDFYVSSDLTTWQPLTATPVEGPSNNRLYSFEVDNAYFKFSTKGSQALYLNSVAFYL